MSEEELERIRRRKLAQWRNRLMAEKSRKEQIDSKQELLNRVFVGRAWEVFHAAQRQYPQVAKWLGDVIAQLVSAGKIQRVTGGELNYLLRRMGVRVRLKTKIRIKKDGKLISLAEKMKE